MKSFFDFWEGNQNTLIVIEHFINIILICFAKILKILIQIILYQHKNAI